MESTFKSINLSIGSWVNEGKPVCIKNYDFLCREMSVVSALFGIFRLAQKKRTKSLIAYSKKTH